MKIFKKIGRAISSAAKSVGNFIKKNPVVSIAAGAFLIPGLGAGKALSGIFAKAGGVSGILSNPAVKKLATTAATTLLTNSLGGKPKSQEQYSQQAAASDPYLEFWRQPSAGFGDIAKLIDDNRQAGENFKMPSFVPTTVNTNIDPMAPLAPPSLQPPQAPSVGQQAAPLAPPPLPDDQRNRPRAFAIRGSARRF